MYGFLPLTRTAYAAIYDQVFTSIQTGTDFRRTRARQRIQPAPIAVFYEIETVAGSFFRVVDLGDKEGSVLTPPTNELKHLAGTHVDFDGNAFRTITISRSEIEDSAEGRFPEISLTVSDPTGEGAQLLRDNDGLQDATVTIWVIEQDKIAEPELARKRIFRVKSSHIGEGPKAIEVILGSPNIVSLSFPRIRVNGRRCYSEYPNRFDHDGEQNYCNNPSDEFELQTRQPIRRNGLTGEDEFLNGWFAINHDGSANTSEFGVFAQGTGFTTADRHLYVSEGKSDPRWLDGNRNGVFLYKKILSNAEQDTDVDYYSKLRQDTANTLKPDSMIGLLVQSVASAGNWIFWGISEQGITGTFDHTSRVTASSVSTTTDLSDNGHNSFRIQRSGSTWKLYSRTEDLTSTTPDTSSWTLRRTESLTISGDIRVGLVLASDNAVSTSNIWAQFFFMRFLAGGFTSCNRSWANCDLRRNLIQNQIFLGLPSVKTRVI